jgi:V-type H+-transporting ATPase subunit a
VEPRDHECIYPFGIDPVWGRSKNNLQYVNSLKMKLSVIIAIIHMTVGVIIKALNSRYFKKGLDFWFEFVPQFIFLFLLFGYMDFLIVFKWLKDWTGKTQVAPSIISTMMNIGLKLGKTVFSLF